MPSILEVQEFFVEGRDPGRAHVLLHIAEPTAPHEKERGYLFALVEITQGSPEQIQKFQELIDKVEINFYAKEQEREYLLERVLQNINRAATALLDYPGSAIHAIVGSLRGHAVALAYHGAPKAALFYSSAKQMEVAEIIEADNNSTGAGEILDSSTGKMSDSGTGKGQMLFSEIIEGSINPGDYLFLATPHVADYFTIDRVRKLVESRTTRQSMAHVEKVLNDVGSDYSFGGILFHLTDETDTPRTGAQPKTMADGSEQSLNKLLAATKSTENTLSPPLLGDMGKKLGSNIKSLLEKRRERKTADNARKSNSIQERAPNRAGAIETNHRYGDKAKRDGWIGKMLIGLGRVILMILRGIIEVARAVAQGIAHSVSLIFLVITNRRNGRARAIANLRLAIVSKRRFIAQLPTISKIILCVTIFLMLIFLGSLVFLKVKETQVATQRAYDNIIAGIKNKKDAAEASLIYDQKNKAVELIREAESLLPQLSQKNKKQKDTAKKLTEELLLVSKKLQNKKILTPELIADISTKNKEARVTVLAKINDTLIALGLNDKNLYTVNLSTKEVNSKTNEVAQRFSHALVPAEEDKVILLTNAGELAEYDPKTGALVAKIIGFPASSVTISAAGIYNRKLYLVDATAKQIYKHSPTQAGYDKGSVWLKIPNNALSQARALALDGDIYVLTKDGNVRKFFTGDEQTFAVTGLDPLLNEPTELVTSGDLKDIFILEPSGKRLIVLDKTGFFKIQYTADAWQSPTGLVVEDNGKTAYVLDQNKIYKVTL